MSIGSLTFQTHKIEDPDTGEVKEEGRLQGDLSLLTFKARLRLDPIPGRPTGDLPDFAVMANMVGHWADVGVAWQNMIGSGVSAGLPMYSVEFSEPEIAKHIKSCAAFPDPARDGAYLVERERKRPNGQAKGQGGEAGQGRAA